MGKNDHLEVWNHEIIRQSMKDEPPTKEDRESLAAQGI